jgi:hypothetical protein
MIGDTDHDTHPAGGSTHQADQADQDPPPSATEAPREEIPGPTLAQVEAVVRNFIHAYPLATVAGAVLGGYGLARFARLLRRLR